MIATPDLRRLSLIGDSVFAVSITLNARAVTIPRLDAQALGSAAFGQFVDGVAAVLLSVVVACAFWLGHWRYFRHVRRTSSGFIATHFLFLLFFFIVTLSTDLYATNRMNGVATFVYGANLLALTIVALLFRLAAVRHSPGRIVTRYDWMGLTGLIALFTVALAVAYRRPELAQALWYVGLASPVLETWLSRRMERAQGAARPA